MKKLLITFCLFVGGSMGLWAQSTFTEHLTKSVPGKGTVILHHDAIIERLVNGLPVTSSLYGNLGGGVANVNGAGQNADESIVDGNGYGAEEVLPDVPKMKVNGYRIQVYAGGNSRSARQEALRAASRVKGLFSEHSVYTLFQSPRWVCRMGDFRTQEEAIAVLQQLRATGMFDEAVVVRSKVLVAY